MNIYIQIETYELEPGYYNFLWQYSKALNSQTNSADQMSMRVQFIEITGTETTDFECTSCQNGSSAPGSDRCEFCKENTYFEARTGCLNCPTDTISPKNSIGKKSCIKQKICVKENYSSIINDECINGNHSVDYEMNSFSSCKEKENADAPNLNKPKPGKVKCKTCTEGYHISIKNDNTESPSTNNSSNNPPDGICTVCPPGEYTSEINQTRCKKCSNGYTPLILNIPYFTESQLNHFDNQGWNIMNNKLYPNNTIANPALIKEIEITQETGNVKINLTVLRDLRIGEYFIHSLNGTSLNPNYVKKKGQSEINIRLSNGMNKIKLELSWDTSNTNSIDYNYKDVPLTIDSIVITNSNKGGGYKCIPCPEDSVPNELHNKCSKCRSGTELHKNNNLCLSCKKDYFRDQLNNKCEECPVFTTSSKSKNSCVLLHVIHNKRLNKRFVLSGLFEKQQTALCNLNEDLCYGSFIGPITTPNKDIFYISLKNQDRLSITDFSISKEFNTVQNGYVFSLKPSNGGNEEDTNKNTKLLYNMGSRIEYVKIMSETDLDDIDKKKDGIVIKYNNGDPCPKYANREISTIVIITCEKEPDSLYNITPPVFVKSINDGCTNIFEWKTKYGCPSCLNTEVDALHVIS